MNEYNELLCPAIPLLLRKIPERWQEFDVYELTDVEQKALTLLIAAGMVERQWSVQVSPLGSTASLTATLTATGEYGFGEALDKMWAELYNRWGGVPTEVPRVNRVPPELWRLTADGQMAIQGLNNDNEQVVIDWVLKQGFFDGKPRLLPDGRISVRKPLRGHGTVVRVVDSTTEKHPPMASSVSVANWKDGAQAFAEAFKCLPKDDSEAPGKSEADSIGRFLSLMDSNAPKIMAIADSKDLTVEQKMRAICEIDATYYGKKSPDWAKLLGVSKTAITKNPFWKGDRRKYIGEAIERFRDLNPDSPLPDWLNNSE